VPPTVPAAPLVVKSARKSMDSNEAEDRTTTSTIHNVNRYIPLFNPLNRKTDTSNSSQNDIILWPLLSNIAPRPGSTSSTPTCSNKKQARKVSRCFENSTASSTSMTVLMRTSSDQICAFGGGKPMSNFMVLLVPWVPLEGGVF
jgi:hypothetical protein